MYHTKIEGVAVLNVSIDFKRKISFRDFFEYNWLQGEVKADYIQSIKQDIQDNKSVLISIVHRKVSEDIFNDKDDNKNEVIKELLLKYIGYQLQIQIVSYLDLMFEDINKMKLLCENIQNSK